MRVPVVCPLFRQAGLCSFFPARRARCPRHLRSRQAQRRRSPAPFAAPPRPLAYLSTISSRPRRVSRTSIHRPRRATPPQPGCSNFLTRPGFRLSRPMARRSVCRTRRIRSCRALGVNSPFPTARRGQRILALRSDPQIAAKVAGAFTAKNQSVLADNLGRNPSEGELYIAHFLGASGASDLIKLASQSPDSAAASSFPDAASSNRSIFYDRSGRAKSAAEVYSNLVFGHNTDPVQSLVAAQTTPAQAQPIAYAENDPSKGAYTARDTGKPLFGLFRGSDTGPVAKPILNAWSGLGRNAAGNGAQLSALSKGSFFPRADGAPDAEPAPIPDAVASRPAQALADVPLPPQRPQSFKLSPAQKQSGAGAPLDLLSFIRQRV